jgi:hypothetical protein
MCKDRQGHKVATVARIHETRDMAVSMNSLWRLLSQLRVNDQDLSACMRQKFFQVNQLNYPFVRVRILLDATPPTLH